MWDLISKHELDLDLEFADAYMEDLKDNDDGVFWEDTEFNENKILMMGRVGGRGDALYDGDLDGGSGVFWEDTKLNKNSVVMLGRVG
ncbi:hypothetical protein Tco_1279597, partial [Tanacetum coccineum]